MELRDRLYETCQIAHEELQKAKLTQKKCYDRKAKPRQLSVGDKVLLLLPFDTNKLILTWKGPFTVLEKRSEIDYVVDLGTRTSLFHINLLKKYEERPSSTDTVGRAAVTVQTEEPEEEPELPLLALQQNETLCCSTGGRGRSAADVYLLLVPVFLSRFSKMNHFQLSQIAVLLQVKDVCRKKLLCSFNEKMSLNSLYL